MVDRQDRVTPASNEDGRQAVQFAARPNLPDAAQHPAMGASFLAAQPIAGYRVTAGRQSPRAKRAVQVLVWSTARG